jgi:hypothetical protein
MADRLTDREQKLLLARKKLERFQSNRNPSRPVAAPTPPAEIIPIQSASIPVQQAPINSARSEPTPLSIVNNEAPSQTVEISLLIDEKQELLDIQEKLSMIYYTLTQSSNTFIQFQRLVDYKRRRDNSVEFFAS